MSQLLNKLYKIHTSRLVATCTQNTQLCTHCQGEGGGIVGGNHGKRTIVGRGWAWVGDNKWGLGRGIL